MVFELIYKKEEILRTSLCFGGLNIKKAGIKLEKMPNLMTTKRI